MIHAALGYARREEKAGNTLGQFVCAAGGPVAMSMISWRTFLSVPRKRCYRKVCETSGAGKHHDHVVPGVQGDVVHDDAEPHSFQQRGTHFALSGNASTDTVEKEEIIFSLHTVPTRSITSCGIALSVSCGAGSSFPSSTRKT